MWLQRTYIDGGYNGGIGLLLLSHRKTRSSLPAVLYVLSDLPGDHLPRLANTSPCGYHDTVSGQAAIV